MTRPVATAVSGALRRRVGGASAKRLNTTGSTVAGISMFTVPTMVGVRSRLNRPVASKSRSGRATMRRPG